ncbi:KH domain-containing protein HEN4-like [Chenopodium quinoa]|uniref:K Homology domain-containing protein n=1 Tax=Chenopodium quinoa TaxID=63459 RepID=A0A803MCA6_CHEQI|nr:KH domain-containing protein HEN4-like [Chenopodium quinoa]
MAVTASPTQPSKRPPMATTAASKRATPQPTPAGHASLRMLCPDSSVGAFIGKSGSSIKHLQLQTASKIRVDDSLQLGSDHRVIVIVAPNVPFKKMNLSNSPAEVEFQVSAFQEAAVRVFEKVLEVSGEGNAVVICRVLVEANEAGAVIGKGGKTVAKLRRESGAKIRVLVGNKLPPGVSIPDEVVEIEGDVMAVKKALVGICGQLQECSQADKLSIKEGKPLESTSHSALQDFRADHSLHQMPLSVATTPYNPAMRSALESARFPASESKFQKKEVVFKILCLNDRVGGVIGRGGSIIHALQEESGASIDVGLSVANCNERLVTVYSMEDVDARYSPAQRGVVLVYSRYVEAGAERGLEAGMNKGSAVTARLLVSSNQVGCLLGKGAAIISEIRKATGAYIRIHNGDQVPKCAAQDNEVVEISGQFVNIQDALYHVTSRLRNNLFTSIAMNIPGSRTGKLLLDTSNYGRIQDATTVGLCHSFGTNQSIGGQATLSQGLDPLPHPNISQSSPSTGLQTIEPAGVNPRNFDRGLAFATGGVQLGRTLRPAIVTNTVVEIVVPESSISSVYGENGSNLTRIRQISGAKVIVHEAVPGIESRTVVISGTPDQTQAAQSLIHAFILTGSS